MDWMREEDMTVGKVFRVLAGIALGLQVAAAMLSVYIYMDQQNLLQSQEHLPKH